MRVTIIQFSPSGNTLRVSETIKSELERNGESKVQLFDITHNKEFFSSKRKDDLLKNKIKKHDVLLIGGPVYAHHMQYHVQDLIKMLPKPDKDIWGPIAIPFVTYGGIASGIALEEAGKLLKKSGRKVIGGMKISASHKMTRAFMDKEFNEGKPDETMMPEINKLVSVINQINTGRIFSDQSKKLKYASRLDALKINIIFNEKKWHADRYPKVFIEEEKCKSCGKCTTVCPVLHFQKNGNKTIKVNKDSDCIHCLNCVVNCPEKGIKLAGDLEKAKAFMGNIIQKKGNKEQPASFFYI